MQLDTFTTTETTGAGWIQIKLLPGLCSRYTYTLSWCAVHQHSSLAAASSLKYFLDYFFLAGSPHSWLTLEILTWTYFQRSKTVLGEGVILLITKSLGRICFYPMKQDDSFLLSLSCGIWGRNQVTSKYQPVSIQKNCSAKLKLLLCGLINTEITRLGGL
jgi:hypothetical protein